MQMRFLLDGLFLLNGLVLLLSASGIPAYADQQPHIVLMMADDQGWGETGYYNHPVLKTPNLDAMAKNGIRFDRFYAAAPVCSPTRASVLTGRSNNRTGVQSHGYALRLQEKTLPQALAAKGYQCGHFGKWHLNGLRGPGVPILASDDHNPGVFGFHHWLSVTNFFDRDPILSRMGEFEDYQGDSSEIVVEQALKFIGENAKLDRPSFTVIWFGTPHSPFRAAEEDMQVFSDLNESSRNHYGELVALDRSVGTLRKGLRGLGIQENTLFWYCSDNGGLPKISPETVGGLRGFKGSVYEGGLRVPGILEWPAQVKAGQITEHPACVMDIFPTIGEVVGLEQAVMLQPQDGISLVKLVKGEGATRRTKPIPFNCFGETAIVDGNWKLLQVGKGKNAKKQKYELYDLKSDPKESNNLFAAKTEVAMRMQAYMRDWLDSLERSQKGLDYPEQEVRSGEPQPRFWMDVKEYEPYFDAWRQRPEYRSRLKDK